MGDYRGRREADIEASPEACFETMTDYERLPEWQRAVKAARVIEHGEDADLVEYEVDAKLRTFKYRLRCCYPEPNVIDSTYVEGPFRDFSGRWAFEPRPGGGTRASIEVELDAGRWVPGPVARAVEDALLGRAVEDLKRRVEGHRPG
jgi:ribosome-associated toxin RatA of RatAB toxin-antitoxin module